MPCHAVAGAACRGNSQTAELGHQARPFGICKIVPPPTWKPPFMIDHKNFTVRTRVQQVNYLDGQARQRLIFVENLCRFWSKRGQELEKLPVIAQAPLDVCRCVLARCMRAQPHAHCVLCDSGQNSNHGQSLLTRNSVRAIHVRRNCVLALNLHSLAVSLQSLLRNYPRRRHLSQDSRGLTWSDEACAQAVS